jgi:hypothetical protein
MATSFDRPWQRPRSGWGSDGQTLEPLAQSFRSSALNKGEPLIKPALEGVPQDCVPPIPTGLTFSGGTDEPT